MAVTVAEGWKPPYYKGNPIAGSESYNNHNPGNLRVSEYEIANTGSFSVFDNDLTGFYALVRQLEIAAEGRSSLYPAGISVAELFSKYTNLEMGSKALDDYLDIIRDVGGVAVYAPASRILE